ncbi:DNA cytosine methyltransferase [Aeromonas media]|uniref:DNA cytosine methyltransferase n=1 Tax=Aeromonas media TaxID=651 RepID=UPI001118919C|nr:DNA cytosine methyltransferase [Aeromonas media]
MIYGSVCSGIEAASLAWEPLGWNPAWFAEIEPFPSAVLAHHWPHVTNLGDMTKIATAVLRGDVVAPDILVGGTPCQAFSVAGAREGLADDRGFLTIKYVELANAIDQKRAAAGAVPCITVWENVPGVLSSKDNAFGAFLGFLAGEDCELVPPGKKWENAGCVLGPQRAIAWRILDAQYFGVAQRRRRVFVVASAREGFDPAKVLFECEGLRRDFAPSREAGPVVAALTANGVGTCGADDNQGQAGHLIPLGTSTWPVSHCLNAGGMGRIDYETETMVVHGTQDPDTNTELAHTLGRNQGQENAVAYSVSLRGREGGATAELGGEVAGCLRASSGGGDKAHVLAPVLTQYGNELAGTLTARHDSSPCADRGQNMVVAPTIALQTDVTVNADRKLIHSG